MSRCPNQISGHAFTVDCVPWDPDEHGGGFPVVQVNATIYGPDGLDKLIKALERRRKWLTWNAEKYGGEP